LQLLSVLPLRGDPGRERGIFKILNPKPLKGLKKDKLLPNRESPLQGI